MGKKKYPDDDQIEILTKEIRKLKSINRNLSKRLKKLDRKFVETDVEDDEDEPILSNTCPKCARGDLIEVDLGPKKLKRCTICDHRTKTYKA